MNKNPVKSSAPIPGKVQAKPGQAPGEHPSGSKVQSPASGKDKGATAAPSSPKTLTTRPSAD